MALNNRARKQAKREAARPLSELEKAIQAIDRATEQMNATKDRKPCYCLATKHQLNIYAPNCLNCGKIICSLEGPGPCTYCGKPVVSIEQQQQMVLEMKREKAQLAKQLAQEKKQQQPGYAPPKRKVKAAHAISTAGYASKLGGGMTTSTGSAGGWVNLQEASSSSASGQGGNNNNSNDNNSNNGTTTTTAFSDFTTGGMMTEAEELEEARKLSLAQAHKERLLEYDRTSARRSHVIDQAADFVMPGDRPNLWLSDQERAVQEEKARANLDRVTEQAKGFQRAKVLTIDVKNRRVVVEDSFQAPDSDDDGDGDEDVDDAVPPPVDKMDLAKRQGQSTSTSGGNRHGGRGTYALNPLLRLGENPIFILPPKHKEKDLAAAQDKKKKKNEKKDEENQSKGDGSSKPATTSKDKTSKGDGDGDGDGDSTSDTKEESKKTSPPPRPRVPRLQYDDDHVGASQSVMFSMSEAQNSLATIVEPSCG
ncbi:hypothetical protein DFQ27_006340 [Actinomortierella ambigua]|uniref:TRIP4/RQT4 C2HC5-type zinc finger domain-containing protein n=1 Tax=Actinomortierella ambigua TaxID=1343610 RepID=A0A9P6PZA6_9FUNG|nr:hypothetical protein DFQ27_006340 [Actinomortierella ambigua]